MNAPSIEFPEPLEVVSYNSAWPEIYAAERAQVLSVAPEFIEFEHIGSTAVPGLRAKPIIDMMASVERLEGIESLVTHLNELGYVLFETGMQNRFFLRKYPAEEQKFHLHIVEQSTWAERKERLMRDYLRKHPDEAAEYGALKDGLVDKYRHDSDGYTKAKTAFIQGVMDRARAMLGLPSEDVWEN
ncbi:MAG: GrpB family protein [Anaerolineales bacterium]|nr:GrpB family protein [Anaerolineales bacterium]